MNSYVQYFLHPISGLLVDKTLCAISAACQLQLFLHFTGFFNSHLCMMMMIDTNYENKVILCINRAAFRVRITVSQSDTDD